MEPNTTPIVDAAFDVAVFSKLHAWPVEGSPEFFEFAQKLDRLACAIQAAYPMFNRNVRRDYKLTKALADAAQIAAQRADEMEKN
jgi:hypothetical protein